MLQRVTRLIRSDTAKDASAMTAGTGAGAVTAAVFFIIAARVLGPEHFGVFSLATAASFMFADMFDLALNAALVRFVSRELRKESGESDLYLKFILKVKLGIGLILLTLSIVFSGFFSKVLFGNPLPAVLILTGMGTAFQLIYTYGVAHLQARRRFAGAAGAIALVPAVRLVGLLVLFVIRSMGTLQILLVYFLATPIGIGVTALMAPRTFLKANQENRVAKKFLGYALPLTAGFTIAALSGRIDNFILANLSGSEAVGYYAAAFRLFTPFQFLSGSLSTVFAPRFSSFANSGQARTYFKKGILATVLMSTGLLLFLPLAPLLIELFYGADYARSVPVLRILFFGFAVFLLQVPFTATILYYLAKTRVFALISGVQLILIVAGNLVLIPRYEEGGSAMAFVGTQLVVLALMAAYSFVKLKDKHP